MTGAGRAGFLTEPDPGWRSPLAPYRIGDPGQAAREVPSGPPGTRTGGADAELSAAALPGFEIRAATVRGVRHRADDEPRGDAFALGRRTTAGGREQAIAVVCDGGGSFGDTAFLVSRQLIALACAGVDWPEAFSDARTAIGAHAVADMLAGRDGVCPDTAAMPAAVAGLLISREDGDWSGDGAWMGDCSLWHLTGQGEWVLLAGYQDGCATLRFRVGDGPLFLMTDGVADPLRWSEQVRQALAQWWQTAPDPFTFCAQASFASKSHVDDRTVIGFWPAP